MDIRCVVTRQNASGKSLIMRDKGVQPVSVALLPGYEFHRVWEAILCRNFRRMELRRRSRATFLLRMASASILHPAAGDEDAHRASRHSVRIGRDAGKVAGMMDVLEPDHPGMHTTETVDFDVVISGEVYLELDDGAEVLLKAGDCVIQNGTRHAWHNRSAEKCVIAVTLVGAVRKP